MMANLFENIRNAFSRARIGKYDSQTIGDELGIYGRTWTGSNITETSALGISAVYACVQRISSTIAGLGLEIHERNGRSLEIASGHPSYDLVRSNPNPDQTAFEFWENIFSFALIQGVGRAIILRDDRGFAKEMYVVPNEDVDERNIKGKRLFFVRGHGTVFPENMLEISNLHRKSPIALHRENLGLAHAAMEFGAKYFGNGGQMTGIMSTDQALRAEQMKEIIRTWNSQGAAGTKILSHGFKYNRVSIAPNEAQFIETRKMQGEEIARIFGVPPGLIWLDTQTTYNNTEQQMIQFARHTITPWAIRAEQEMDRKLLQIRDRQSMFFKYRMNDLARGDMAARSSFYREMYHIGAISPNEIREREDMNPIPGGDTHVVATNLVSMDRFDEFSMKLSNENSNDQNSSNLSE